MRLDPLGTLTLTYSHLTELSYEAGGQVYGALEGTIEGAELRGRLHVTNLAPHRTDGEFAPKLRGTLTTEDGAKMFVTMDGISSSSPERILRYVWDWSRSRSGARMRSSGLGIESSRWPNTGESQSATVGGWSVRSTGVFLKASASRINERHRP